MKVTKIKVFPFEQKEGSKVLAGVSLTFDDFITINRCALIEGKDGPFLSMPSVKSGEKYTAIVWREDLKGNSAYWKEVTDACISEYEKMSLGSVVVNASASPF